MNGSINFASSDLENTNTTTANDNINDFNEIHGEIESVLNKLEYIIKRFSSKNTIESKLYFPHNLPSLAEAIYKSRRKRSKYISKSLLAEPAWDMLLDLFINSANQRDVSTTSLCIASDVPATTGLRWIQTLEKEGLVERIAVPNDRRVSHIRLTNVGYEAVRSSLMRSYEAPNQHASGRTEK